MHVKCRRAGAGSRRREPLHAHPVRRGGGGARGGAQPRAERGVQLQREPMLLVRRARFDQIRAGVVRQQHGHHDLAVDEHSHVHWRDATAIPVRIPAPATDGRCGRTVLAVFRQRRCVKIRHEAVLVRRGRG